MRLVFHIGIHKTGSSLIQKNLSDNLDVLRKNGVFYANQEMPHLLLRQREQLRRVQVPHRSAPDIDSLKQINGRLLQAAKQANAGTIVMSEENRIGFPLYTEMAKVGTPAGFYPRADECLRRILSGLEAQNTQIIVYKRDFERLLPSLYSEALRNLATTETMDGFCQQIDFATLDYGQFIARIMRGAPHAELVVKPFERIRDGAKAFLEDFLKTTQLRCDGFVFSTETVRESVDVQKADALGLLAQRRHREGMSKEIATRRNEILAEPKGNAGPILLPDWVVSKLSAGCPDIEGKNASVC